MPRRTGASTSEGVATLSKDAMSELASVMEMIRYDGEPEVSGEAITGLIEFLKDGRGNDIQVTYQVGNRDPETCALFELQQTLLPGLSGASAQDIRIISIKANDKIPTKMKLWDEFLGHSVFNLVLPVALFSVLGQYDPKAVQAIVEALGPQLPKWLPAANVAWSGILTLMVNGAQRCCQKDYGKKDNRVHTPFPFLQYLTRSEAFLVVVIGVTFQTWKACLADTNPDAPVEGVLNTIYNDELLSFFGQLLAARAFKSVDRYFGHAISNAAVSAASTAWEWTSWAATSAAGACCGLFGSSYCQATDADEIEGFLYGASEGYGTQSHA